MSLGPTEPVPPAHRWHKVQAPGTARTFSNHLHFHFPTKAKQESHDLHWQPVGKG
ncbi:hypothetical protein P7K49_009187, partial [Saguinus oedipus]